MAKDIKIDYNDIFGDMKWDLDKAKYLLSDIQKYFDCPDLQFPSREAVDTVKYEYEHIAVMLSLLGDIIEKLAITVTPLM